MIDGLLSKYNAACGFYLFCSSFFLFSSPILSGRKLDVYHSSTHDVALECEFRMQTCLKCAARGSLKIQDAKKSPKNHHLRTVAQLCRAISPQLRHISTIGQTF